jgi:hypothetical protein
MVGATGVEAGNFDGFLFAASRGMTDAECQRLAEWFSCSPLTIRRWLQRHRQEQVAPALAGPCKTGAQCPTPHATTSLEPYSKSPAACLSELPPASGASCKGPPSSRPVHRAGLLSPGRIARPGQGGRPGRGPGRGAIAAAGELPGLEPPLTRPPGGRVF